MTYIRDRKWCLRKAISKRNCKNLTDVRTVCVLQRNKERYGKFSNRQKLLDAVFESDLPWQERIAWIDRVIDYVGPKKETFEYQCVLHNSVEKATALRDIKSERITGENNPGYQHGGKLSAFSKNFIHASDEVKENAIKASKETKSKNKHKENTTIEYYLHRGMGLCQAIEARKERQAVGRKENFIKRYGEEEGLRRWEQRQEKWVKSYNDKTPEEMAEINSRKIGTGYTVSKNEKELFFELNKHVDDVKVNLSLPYNEGKNYYVYDIYKGNKIIEYNGDMWHANPNKFKEDWINPISKKSSTEIWDKEKHKNGVAKDHNYEIFYVWESDYNKDKEGIVTKCIEFLNQ